MTTRHVGFGRLVARFAVFFGLIAWAQTGTAQVAAAKKQEGGLLGGKWYGTAEVRHHVNTYYDQAGFYARQEPSTHVRLQLGAQFYEGLIDAYATLGVFKIPETQQIMQRQPELAFDLYPYRGQYLTVLQYNLLQLPVKEAATAPVSEDDRSSETQATRGTVYTIGLAPTFKVPVPVGSTRVDFKGGFDGWTRLYSRRQYVEGMSDEDDEGRFGLSTGAADTGDQEPIEDYAMHYRSQILAGAAIEPSMTKGFTGELTAHHHSRFDPRYVRDQEGTVDYEYGATRYSYYRIRLRYELTERLAITNDFYHFFDGAFQAKRDGDDRRFRNIMRLSCKL